MDKRWDALYINTHLATMDDPIGYGSINNAALGISDGQISFVGPMEALPQTPTALAATLYDCKHKWITPGLIDCHTHLVYAGQRAHEFEQRLQGRSYADIAREGGGIMATVKATRAASHDELYEQSAKRLRALLAEGVTTIEIKSGYGLDEATEIKQLKVIKALGDDFPVTVHATYLGAHTLPAEYSNPADYIHFICSQMLPHLHAEKLASAVDIYCEHIAFEPSHLRDLFQEAKQYGFTLKCHAEQLSYIGASLLASEFNALSVDHLEYTPVEIMPTLAKAGITAVLLPGAFYYLHEKQLPPIEALRAHQVPIAIATDCNPGSSPTSSLLLMLNMACTLFRLTPAEALAGITRNAARALGIQNTHGTLTVGKQADFVIWDIDEPAQLAYELAHNPCFAISQKGELRMHTHDSSF